MKIKKLMSLIVAGALAFSMAACGQNGGGAAAPAADTAASGGGKVGISMPTQSLERWNRDGSYLDEKFKEAGYETSLTYADNTGYTEFYCPGGEAAP